jgi:hypothetical protein
LVSFKDKHTVSTSTFKVTNRLFTSYNVINKLDSYAHGAKCNKLFFSVPCDALGCGSGQWGSVKIAFRGKNTLARQQQTLLEPHHTTNPVFTN